jgi:hypothetical protein
MLARIPQFLAEPFVMDLIHHSIPDDRVRAAIVSIRSTAAGIFAAAIAWLLYALSSGKPSTGISLVLTVVATMNLAALLTLWRKVRQRHSARLLALSA